MNGSRPVLPKPTLPVANTMAMAGLIPVHQRFFCILHVVRIRQCPGPLRRPLAGSGSRRGPGGSTECRHPVTLNMPGRARRPDGLVQVVPATDQQTRVLVDVARCAGDAVPGGWPTVSWPGRPSAVLNLPASTVLASTSRFRCRTVPTPRYRPGFVPKTAVSACQGPTSATGIRTDLTYHTERGFSGGPVHALLWISRSASRSHKCGG